MWFRSLKTPQLPPSFRYLLDDGLAISVRPIRADDADRLRRGHEQLSQLARRRRFGSEDIRQLSDSQVRRLVTIDHVNHVAWGASNPERPEEPGIGIARYVRLNGEPNAADVAIIIADAYQGRGAGFVLQACLHLTAHQHGLHTFYYDVSSDNERIIQHLKLMGAMHAGRADNIDRLVLPVYHRAWDVPDGNPVGRRFAEVFKRLQHVSPLAVAA